MGTGPPLSWDSMRACQTQVCHHYTNRIPRATDGSRQANWIKICKATERGYGPPKQKSKQTQRNCSHEPNIWRRQRPSLFEFVRYSFPHIQSNSTKWEREQTTRLNNKVKNSCQERSARGRWVAAFHSNKTKNTKSISYLLNSQGDQDTAILGQHSSNTAYTREQKHGKVVSELHLVQTKCLTREHKVGTNDPFLKIVEISGRVRILK